MDLLDLDKYLAGLTLGTKTTPSYVPPKAELELPDDLLTSSEDEEDIFSIKEKPKRFGKLLPKIPPPAKKNKKVPTPPSPPPEQPLRRSTRNSAGRRLLEPEEITPIRPTRGRRGRKKRTDVNVVDLTESPRVTAYVNLDPDAEDECKSPLEDKNYEVNVKVQWNGTVERHVLRRFDHFSTLMTKFAEREGADAKNVVLMRGESILNETDSPFSINYRITDILTGRIVEGMKDSKAAKGAKRIRKNKDLIKVKLQAATIKRPIEIEINKLKTFEEIMEQVADALKVKKEDLVKLKFDDDDVDLMETPEDLEFEGGEMLDCIVASK